MVTTASHCWKIKSATSSLYLGSLAVVSQFAAWGNDVLFPYFRDVLNKINRHPLQSLPIATCNAASNLSRSLCLLVITNSKLQ